MTQVRHVGKPQRWDESFGIGRVPARDVKRVLASPVFATIDPEDFPEDLALGDIIANDGRILRCARGQIVVRRGDYGNSLFVILKGAVRGMAHKEDEDEAFRPRRIRKMSWFRSLSQLWRNASVPEARTLGLRKLVKPGGGGPVAATPAVSVKMMNAAVPDAKEGLTDDPNDAASGIDDQALSAAGVDPGAVVSLIDDVDDIVERYETFGMAQDDMFGELAALARSPRTSTVFVTEEGTELLELRWQGVRDIRQWSEPFHKHIDDLYRERGLASRLRDSQLFDSVDDEVLRVVVEKAHFETHGHFEWTHRYKREVMDDQRADQVIGHEPLIVEQGHYLEGLLLIHSGFARVSEKFDHGEKTVGYLAKDDVFGLEEIIATRDGEQDLKSRRSLRAIGYVDVIRVPTHVVEQYLLPAIDTGAASDTNQKQAIGEEDELQQSLLDFLVDRRFINGTQAMAINTDRCVNCDDCVRACAATHDNNPRFVRHGLSHQNLMVANACMHCVDPVCLIGCPTGAIHREQEAGQVVIDDNLCVGCATCANSCPYNNIRMVEIRDTTGAFLTDPEGRQIYRATKCDLCASQISGPACQRACPHDALMRIDIRDTRTLTEWLGPGG